MKFLFPILLASAVAGLSSADDWPRFRGPEADGISRETGWKADWPDSEPQTIWEAQVGIGFSCVTVSEGRAYVTGHDGEDVETLFCFDAATGAEIWKHAYPHPLDDKYYEGGPTSTPTIHGDVVYLLTKRGTLFARKAADGAEVWTTNVAAESGAAMPTWGFTGSPVVHGDLLLLTVGEAGTALDRASGKVRWKSGKAEAGYSTPVLFERDGETLMIVSNAREWVCVEPATGAERWRFKWLTKYGVNAADPIVRGDEVFIASGYEKGCALLKMTADGVEEIWKNKEMRSQMNPCILIGEHLYGIDGNQGGGGPRGAGLKCITWETGEARWRESSVGHGAPLVANGKLIVLGEKGELMIAPLSPDSFEPTLRVQILGGRCWTVPTLANGLLYARNAKGHLVCVKLKE